MTRGRTIWLALLAVGLLVALYLRTPSAPQRVPEARPAPSHRPPSTGETDEVEIELADPSEDAKKLPAAMALGERGESDLLNGLRVTWETKPEHALELAEKGERLFGESPYAVERRLYEIKALVKLGRIGSARTKAETYLEKYPPGPMTNEVERLTGVHRRPEPEKTP